MLIFQGPLADHINYLNFIALPNCHDYFDTVGEHREKNKNNTPDKYQRLRLFLNAIESLNNVVEYFFHEYKDSQGWTDAQMGNKLGDIRAKHPILRDIEQIANGYKHCVRKNPAHLQASDMQSPLLKAVIDRNGVNVEYEFDSIEDIDIMTDAFSFFIDYNTQKDINILLP